MSYEEQDDSLEIPANFMAAIGRYKLFIVAAIFVLVSISVAVATLIPAVYRSESLVLVETQQIPNELVKSTVTSIAAERIQIIKQRVMTREKLLKIAEKYPTLKENSSNLLISELVQQMRDNITVELITGNKTSYRSNETTIAFRVAFDALSPQVSQSVANDLVTLFLNENVKARTERASETTDFLRSEADKMKKRLSDTEQAIADYKQEYKDALPEHLDLYISMLERAQSNRLDFQRQIEVEKNQRSLYELQGRGAVRSEAGKRLDTLESEYKSLSAIYQESHPDIIRINEEIALLKSRGGFFGQGDRGLLQSKLNASDGQIKLLEKQLEKNQNQIRELEAKIIKIPQVERGLISLNRDYEAVKEQYDHVVGNTMQAQMAESLEQGRKAERFSILEPPLLPDQPYKPNRKKLLAMGLGLSFSLPLGLLLLVAFLDKSIRGAAAVEKITGCPPLVTIGYIQTEVERRKKKLMCIRGGLAAIAVLVLGVIAVHFLVSPLDLLIYKFMYKFEIA